MAISFSTSVDAWRSRRLVAMLMVIACVLALPRGVLDYGQNGDALDNAGDALALWAYGPIDAIPHMIRWPPGIPVFIWLLAAVVPWGGHVAANLLVFSSYLIAIALFAAIVWTDAHRLLLIATFAMTPFLLLNAAVAQDFMLGLAAALAAYLALSRRAYVLAGVLLGVGMGLRITNALLVLPALIHLCFVEPGWRARLRAAAVVSALMVVVGLTCYAPFLYASGLGWRYFLPLPGHGAPLGAGWRTAAYNWLTVFGVAATAGLIALAARGWRRIADAAGRDWRDRNPAFLFSLATIAIYALVSFRFTMKAEYAMPAIPFVFLLFARWFGRRALVAVLILVSSYALVAIEVKGGISGRRELTLRPAPGLLVQDWQRRRELRQLRAGVGALKDLDRAVVLTGMGGVLTYGNGTLEPATARDISPRLPEAAGRSQHRGVGTLVHRVRGTSVFVVTSLAREHVDLVRGEGYRVFMFSEFAPSAAVNGHHYDPYAMGIAALPVFGPDAFYRRRAGEGS